MPHSSASQFEPAPCRYAVPAGLFAESGYLSVPEYHARPGAGGRLRLYATLIKSREARQAREPLVWLHGGPGGCGLPGILSGASFQERVLSQYDLLVFDQRGTGFSEPALAAPEMQAGEAEWIGQPLDADERATRYVEAALRCRDRLVAEGVHPDAYNTTESAADVADLCLALGYERANWFGISYGTRLGLAVMRDFPERVRSIVLDSVVPMQVNQYAEAKANTAGAFGRLFADVAADPQARRVFPDLEAQFFELVRHLNAHPLWVQVPSPQGEGTTRVFINGEVLTGFFYLGFYGKRLLPHLPRLVVETRAGNTRLVEQIAALITAQQGPSFEGMYFCVNLFDDKVLPATRQAIRQADREYPQIGPLPYSEFHLGEHIVDLAERWGARRPGPEQYQAVQSDLPTLILAGRYDQNTPPHWARLAGEALSHSAYFEVPNIGHGALQSGEYMPGVLRAFYDHPEAEPDRAWLAQVPQVVFAPPEA